MKLNTLMAVLACVAVPAHAGFESMMNPMAMMNPAGMMNPAAMMNPVAMMNPASMLNPASLLNPMANPLAFLVPMTMMGSPMGMGMMNPVGMAVPMMGLGGAMQVAPQMMSFSHQNQMANPFLGGPLAGNPYLGSGFPALPFASAPNMPPVPPFPFASPAAMSGQAPAALPFDPMQLLNMLSGAMPARPAQ
ncbi:MAG: hypothetical protein ACOZB0_11825 [Pseudomonadota bacterium]